MEASVMSIDDDLKKYISQLSLLRKKSILELIKLWVEEDEILGTPQTIEEYNKELEESEKEIEAGEFYTHEEVKTIMNSLFK